jgi:hypothetical protein
MRSLSASFAVAVFVVLQLAVVDVSGHTVDNVAQHFGGLLPSGMVNLRPVETNVDLNSLGEIAYCRNRRSSLLMFLC